MTRRTALGNRFSLFSLHPVFAATAAEEDVEMECQSALKIGSSTASVQAVLRIIE